MMPSGPSLSILECTKGANDRVYSIHHIPVQRHDFQIKKRRSSRRQPRCIRKREGFSGRISSLLSSSSFFSFIIPSGTFSKIGCGYLLFYREHHFILQQRCLGMGKMVYETTKWEGGFLSFLLFMISWIFTKVGEKRRERRRTSCVAFTSRSIIIIVNCIQHITLHYITLHCNDPLDFVQSEAISVTKRVQSILWA